MNGKRSNPVLFLLLSIISFSNAEPKSQTLFVNDDDARSALHQTAASNPDSQFSGDILSMEMLRRDLIFPAHEKMNRSHIMKKRLKRDRSRVESLSSRVTTIANGTVISGVTRGSGEYFTRLAIGTPAQQFYMVLDTGSDTTWLQCRPCKHCYKQTDPYFNPSSSTTFSVLSCDSEPCMQLDSPGCNTTTNMCQYKVLYGDGSSTAGDLATETLTLGHSSVSRIAIGCGYDNEGLFVAAGGLLGLGAGNLSFPNQATKYGRQFSYCLVSRVSKKKSFITFGKAPVSKNNTFTPLIINMFYYVNLIQISVGGAPVPGVTSAIFKKGGGVIVDSGTSVTRLKESAYYAVRDALRNATKLKPVAPPTDMTLFDTCYDLSSSENVKVPAVVLHFEGGAEMDLPADNYIVPVDNYGTFCFAFAPYKGMSIIGNIQQQGFRVTYDLAGKRIGFAPQSC